MEGNEGYLYPLDSICDLTMGYLIGKLCEIL